MSEAILPKQYRHEDHEEKLYVQWEKSGAFTPKGNPGKEPFSILMPPPNANASLHAGHAMYVIQDIMTRFKRKQGHTTVWFPGTDHAGFETQFVYEKHLKKEGKSRFQFDSETLYKNIFEFVKENSGLIENQMRRLGFSADWSQKTFTLEDRVVSIVLDTFKKLSDDGLIYRDNYLVNYCPKCGTTFADLEVLHEEQTTPLTTIRYRFADGEPRIINGEELMYITVATVRPETIFADAAIAIHPDDPRANALQGEFVLNPLTKMPIPIILDDYVDPEFGTGMLKITPAHDPNDFELGKKHNLPLDVTINTLGKITLDWLTPSEEPAKGRSEQLKMQFDGLSVFHARPAVIKLLEIENSIDYIDEKYKNNVTVCYKGKHIIEPIPYPNWFVKMAPLAELGLKAVDEKQVKIIPNRFTKQYKQWLENIRDWPISRQIVWGIRMPVWYNGQENKDIFVSFLDSNGERKNITLEKAFSQGNSLDEIKTGLQSLIAPINTPYIISKTSPGKDFIQETDTFDTWFSSGQWPLVVLDYPNGENFQKFYPTSLLDTMWDIIFFWVARMIMLGTYLTGEVPFKNVYLHSMVTDAKGAKMSKSKGNVINPLDIVEKYGADALRIALVAGSAPGNPIALSESKVKGYRNFGNKIWNIGRFIQLSEAEHGPTPDLSLMNPAEQTDADKEILQQLNSLIPAVTDNLEQFRFSDAALALYDFLWNSLANGYLENNKDRTTDLSYRITIKHVYLTSLHLLHPFMPFVTEAIWQVLQPNEDDLIVAQWPE